MIWYFKTRADGPASPSEVWSNAFPKTVPITSVRRAITELTTRGVLKRTSEKRKGLYGRPEYCWEWARPNPNEQLKLL